VRLQALLCVRDLRPGEELLRSGTGLLCEARLLCRPGGLLCEARLLREGRLLCKTGLLREGLRL
jgi:hypothetical protein